LVNKDVGKDVRKDVRKELKGNLLIIYKMIKNSPQIIIPDIAKKTGLTERSVLRHIETLKKDNYIERIGGRKEGYWKVNE